MKFMLTDEAIFETELDLRTCYVTRRAGTAMESRYLRPTFKSGRTDNFGHLGSYIFW